MFYIEQQQQQNAVPQDHYLPKSQSGLVCVDPPPPRPSSGSKSLLSGLPFFQAGMAKFTTDLYERIIR